MSPLLLLRCPRLLSAVAVSVLLATSCFPNFSVASRERAASQEERFQAAMQAQLDGDPAAARRIYEEMILDNPTNSLVRFQLGTLLLDSLNDPYEAMGEFRAYLRLAPTAEKAEMAKASLLTARNRIAQSFGPETIQSGAGAERFQALEERLAELETAYTNLLATHTVVVAERDAARADAARLLRELQSARRHLDALLNNPMPSAPSSPSAVSATAATPAAPATQNLRTYQVRRGDTLYRIAQRVYGDAARNRDIREANPDKVGPNDELREGDVLVLPY